ncbi:MAG TPA: hypothetical protein VF131_08925 [Blastocatellia bacterium]|nr:hypothetical protein [Blastocatellia bacterium]
MTNSGSNSKTDDSHFIAYSKEFHDVLGDDPHFYTVIETNAHEGPVYIKDEAEIKATGAARPQA